MINRLNFKPNPMLGGHHENQIARLQIDSNNVLRILLLEAGEKLAQIFTRREQAWTDLNEREIRLLAKVFGSYARDFFLQNNLLET